MAKKNNIRNDSDMIDNSNGKKKKKKKDYMVMGKEVRDKQKKKELFT